MENFLNFRQFITNAASWVNGSNDLGPDMEPTLPQVSLDMPTTSTRNPVKVFKVARKGQTYEIHAENNISWNCPAQHYIHLMNAGKAPQVGDKIRLEFYKDGSVKSFNIVERKQRGLAG